VTVGVEGLIVKSGVVDVILPILFVPASNTHVVPDESTITSCGLLPVARGYSVNWPLTVLTIVVVEGEGVAVDGEYGPELTSVSVVEPPAEAVVVCESG
jgi:hypothetical protein